MADVELFHAALLAVLGVAAGIINTLAGGGSNLTIPALMIGGMPADVANATNRVGVLLQSLTGARQFHARGAMPTDDLPAIMAPTLIGGLLGAAAASFAPAWLLKPALLLTMLAMATLMLIAPAVVAPPPGTPSRRVAESPGARWALLGAGFYGGFVQAGVGFVLLAALAGGLRYDLVRSNALKILCTLVFTAVALALFIARDQVAWRPGLILAAGSVLGAWWGVNIAIALSARALKWFVFVMTLVAVAAALLK